MAGIIYSVRKNRLEQAKLRGFDIMEKGGISLSEGTSIHYMFLKGMDSATPDADWTRLHFDIAIPESMTYYTYVFTVKTGDVDGAESKGDIAHVRRTQVNDVFLPVCRQSDRF